MMARPIRALELHYPMIQFLVKKDILHSSNSKIERKGPRYNGTHFFFCPLALRYIEVPLYYVPYITVGNGDTSFSASLNGQNFEYTSMLVRFFVSQVDVSYDLLVKFTRKFFFMISSALPLKYHKEGKRKTTEAFQFIYRSGNFPEKWHPVHRFISLHSLQ